MIRQHAPQGRPQHRPRRVLVCGDAHGPGRLAAQLRQTSEPGLDLVEPGPDNVQEALAGLGRRDAPGGPGEQSDAEAGLKPP